MGGRRDSFVRLRALAEGNPRTLAGALARSTPGSRGWHLLLDRVAEAGCERELVDALELTLRELKADIATWPPIASSASDLPSTAAK
jgi:hypothetical protein